jgi:hypothetical protein
MLPNLTLYNPETFRILGAWILLPPSLAVVVAGNDVILPAHRISFRDHRPTTSPGKKSPSFSHSYFYWAPHVLWPNATLVFLFHPRFIFLISPVTFLTSWTYQCHPSTHPQQIIPLHFPTPDVISVGPILSASPQFSLTQFHLLHTLQIFCHIFTIPSCSLTCPGPPHSTTHQLAFSSYHLSPPSLGAAL